MAFEGPFDNPDLDLCNRIRANDPTLKEVTLQVGLVDDHFDDFDGHPVQGSNYRNVFDALYDNTTVEVVKLSDRGQNLRNSDLHAFASMLSKNFFIKRVELHFFYGNIAHPSYEEPLMKVLTKHGDGIHLETLDIAVSDRDMNEVEHLSNFLTQWPKVAKELVFSCFADELQLITSEPDALLTSVVSSEIESLTLSGDWITLDNVATAVEKPNFRIKKLSTSIDIIHDVETALIRYLDALAAKESIESVEFRHYNFYYTLPGTGESPLFIRFPALHSVRSVVFDNLDPFSLRGASGAVQTHGNIQSLKLRWKSMDDLWEDMDDPAGVTIRLVSGAFTPTSFQGLEEVVLVIEKNWSAAEDDEETEIANAAIAAVSYALNGNPTIRKVSLSIADDMSREVFKKFATETIPSMPNLEVLDLTGTWFDNKRAKSLVKAVKKSSKLRAVNYSVKPLEDINEDMGSSSDEDENERRTISIDEALAFKLKCYCEMNRIGFSKLLAGDLPLGLWPLIWEKTRHFGALHCLLREKPDLLSRITPRETRGKRKLPG